MWFASSIKTNALNCLEPTKLTFSLVSNGEKKKSHNGRFFLGRGHSKRLIVSNNDKLSIHTCSFPRGRNGSAVVRIFKEFCIKKDSCNSYNINQYNIEERDMSLWGYVLLRGKFGAGIYAVYFHLQFLNENSVHFTLKERK